MHQSLTQPRTAGAARRPSARHSPELDLQREPRTRLATLVTSLAVWMLYAPQVTLLRALGPRLGDLWVRSVACLHWLSTFLGIQHQALMAIRTAHPYLDIRLSPRTILRKYLAFKHRCFAQQRVYAVQGQGSNGGVWETMPEEHAEFGRLCQEKRGVIVISYHFGNFRLAAHAAPKAFPGATFCQVRYPEVRYAGRVWSGVARLARQKGLHDDQAAGVEIVYLKPGVAPLELIHRLRNNQAILLAADGMLASQFMDVPFLGGVIRMPTGWACLAGITRAPVAVLMDEEIDGGRRQLRLRRVIRCDSIADDDIRRALVEATAVLENHVRTAPWLWHPWQRLRIEPWGETGKPRYIVEATGDAPWMATADTERGR
jgi:predicted LPLAT superfamily acyltransferase